LALSDDKQHRPHAAICRHQIPVFFIGDKGGISAHFIPQKRLVYAALQHKRNRDRNFCISFIQSLLRGRWWNGIKVLQNLGYAAVGESLEQPVEMLSSLNDMDSIQIWHWQVSRRYRFALNSIFCSIKNVEESWQLAYHLLAHEFHVMLLASGCCVEAGTLHHHCYNHLPLPCDLMEPFRPIVEAWILETVLIDWEDKALNPSNPTAFVSAWEGFLNRQFFHPHAGWVGFRQVLSLQVDEYVRAITEAIEYRPFLLK